jgi:quercetin 2,3-dioxygenase
MSAATACLPRTTPPPSLSHHNRPADDELTTGAGTAATIQDDDVASKPLAIVRTLACERKQVGEGFALWRSIGRPDLPELDPFLSFDEFECTYQHTYKYSFLR